MNILISARNMCCNGEEAVAIELANCLKQQGENVFFHSLLLNTGTLSLRKRLLHTIPTIVSNSINTVKAFIDDNRITVCHAHNIESTKILSSAIQIAHRSNDIRLISTLHGSLDDFGKAEFQREMCTINNKHPVDIWTYVADKNKYIFDSSYMGPPLTMIKIPNGINLSNRPNDILDTSITRVLAEKDPVILTVVSRAVESKGWRESIQVVKTLRNTYRLNAHLFLIGDGPEYRRIKIEEINHFVHLLGFKDNPIDYLNVSTFGMLLSSFKYESFPLCILEALSVGVPVIVTDIGDIRRMITLDNGEMCGVLCYDRSHAESIAREIAAIATSEHRYIAMREKALTRIKSFDIVSVARKYLTVYTQAIELGGPNDKNRRIEVPQR